MLCAQPYHPRSFDQALLHRCVAGHWPRVRGACEAHGRPLPAFVQREFDAYLRCGDLREGFLRIHCAGCGHDRLVPLPRMHLVHDFGVLAPNARLRKQVVPEAPVNADLDPCGGSVAYQETRNGKTIRRRWVPWAQLLLKVFTVDVWVCPRCDGRMHRIAVIEQPKVIAAILDCMARKDQPP